jgi:hypothetical protein
MKIKKTIHVTDKSNPLQTVIAMVSSLDEGVYDVIIMNKDYARSHDQNSLLWGVIYKGLSDHTGYSQEDLHDICRMKFDLKDDDGTLLSTAGLTKTEFNEYVDKIINWSKSLGVSFEKEREGIF